MILSGVAQRQLGIKIFQCKTDIQIVIDTDGFAVGSFSIGQAGQEHRGRAECPVPPESILQQDGGGSVVAQSPIAPGAQRKAGIVSGGVLVHQLLK